MSSSTAVAIAVMAMAIPTAGQETGWVDTSTISRLTDRVEMSMTLYSDQPINALGERATVVLPCIGEPAVLITFPGVRVLDRPGYGGPGYRYRVDKRRAEANSGADYNGSILNLGFAAEDFIVELSMGDALYIQVKTPSGSVGADFDVTDTEDKTSALREACW